MAGFFIIAVIAAVFALVGWDRGGLSGKLKRLQLRNTPIPPSWRPLLAEYVNFYTTLSDAEKYRFEKEIQLFVVTTEIVGVKTKVTELDRVLIASSAVIPIFGFPNWQYDNLDQVILYPSAFKSKFVNGKRSFVLGMVGTGRMAGVMMLSREALIHGFTNETDKKNVGLHEFAHLLDMADGQMDGLPEELVDEHFYAMPWFQLMQEKVTEIRGNKSDIDDYGATNRAEFFAVVTEYFFQRPDLLREKHPKLYRTLSKFFRQDPAKSFKKMLGYQNKVRKNQPCPCGSGKKLKDCCAK